MINGTRRIITMTFSMLIIGSSLVSNNIINILYIIIMLVLTTRLYLVVKK